MNNSNPTPTLITYAVNEALLVLLCIEHSQTSTLLIQLLFVALQIRHFVSRCNVSFFWLQCFF